MMDTTETTVQAARTALVAIDWDGENPMPVVGLMYALISELEASGHPRQSMAEMLEAMGACWAIA